MNLCFKGIVSKDFQPLFFCKYVASSSCSIKDLQDELVFLSIILEIFKFEIDSLV